MDINIRRLNMAIMKRKELAMAEENEICLKRLKWSL